MSDKVFVDSNILIYAHDTGEERKRHVAEVLLEELWRTRSGVVSTQVLQEVYVNVRRIAENPLSREEALRLVEDYGRWNVVVNDTDSITEAIRLEERFQVSFWDALIIQSAQTSGAEIIYTEDLNDGQSYGTVKAVNPFA